MSSVRVQNPEAVDEENLFGDAATPTEDSADALEGDEIDSFENEDELTLAKKIKTAWVQINEYKENSKNAKEVHTFALEVAKSALEEPDEDYDKTTLKQILDYLLVCKIIPQAEISNLKNAYQEYINKLSESCHENIKPCEESLDEIKKTDITNKEGILALLNEIEGDITKALDNPLFAGKHRYDLLLKGLDLFHTHPHYLRLIDKYQYDFVTLPASYLEKSTINTMVQLLLTAASFNQTYLSKFSPLLKSFLEKRSDAKFESKIATIARDFSRCRPSEKAEYVSSTAGREHNQLSVYYKERAALQALFPESKSDSSEKEMFLVSIDMLSRMVANPLKRDGKEILRSIMTRIFDDQPLPDRTFDERHLAAYEIDKMIQMFQLDPSDLAQVKTFIAESIFHFESEIDAPVSIQLTFEEMSIRALCISWDIKNSDRDFNDAYSIKARFNEIAMDHPLRPEHVLTKQGEKFRLRFYVSIDRFVGYAEKLTKYFLESYKALQDCFAKASLPLSSIILEYFSTVNLSEIPEVQLCTPSRYAQRARQRLFTGAPRQEPTQMSQEDSHDPKSTSESSFRRHH